MKGRNQLPSSLPNTLLLACAVSRLVCSISESAVIFFLVSRIPVPQGLLVWLLFLFLFQYCHCSGELLEALLSCPPKLVNALESRGGVGIRRIPLPGFVWDEKWQWIKCLAEEEWGTGGVRM